MTSRREFFTVGLVATSITAGASPRAARGDWFRKDARVFLLDFQAPDPLDQGAPGMPHFFAKLDPAQIVEQAMAAGTNILLVHAKCNQGNAYYNTKVGHKHSDLGDRDLMAEFSRICRKRGIGILYYVQLSRDRRSFTHPERRAIDASGRPVLLSKDNPLLAAREEKPVVCMNGPHRQYIKDILGELSRCYDFDGFWLDCYNWWGRVNPCFCDTCKQTHQRDTGHEIPRESLFTTEEGKRYVRWRRKLNTTILRELVDEVRSINPRLTVTHNGSGLNAFADWEFCDPDDYVSHEFHFNEGYGNLSLLCAKQRALKPGVPFEIELWRFANRLGGPRATARAYQVRSSEVLLSEMASVVANGGFPQYYDQIRPDGTLQPKSLQMLAPAFRDTAVRQKWAGAGNPVVYAAILWSKSTEAFAPREAQSLHRDGVSGAFHALMEEHVPVTVISERDAVAGRWNGARVAVVDAAECISPACGEALDDFVRRGGGAVITCRSSLRDGEGGLLKNFSLARLIGGDFLGMTEKWYSYANPEKEHRVTDGLTLDFPLSVYETLQVSVRPHSGTEALAAIINPLPGFHMGYPPHERTGAPALLVREHGIGRVLYAAAPLGAIYWRFNHSDNKRLIANAVRWAAGSPPPLNMEAPATVEMAAWRDEKARRTIVHLVNRTGAGLPRGEGESMHQVIPVHDLKLIVTPPLSGQIASPTFRKLRPFPSRKARKHWLRRGAVARGKTRP